MIKNQQKKGECQNNGTLFNYERFGTNPDEIRRVLATALSCGGTYSDIYFEYSIAEEVTLRDGEVNSTSYDVDYGMGIRTLNGEKTGYAYSESTTLEDMLSAAKMASQIANSTNEISIPPINELRAAKNRYPIFDSWEDHPIDQRAPFLKKINDFIFSKDERVSKVIARISTSYTEVLFANSLGESFFDIKPLASVVVSVIMEDNGKIENYSSTKSYRMDFSMLNDELIEELSNEAVENCASLFDATKPKGGEMAVVMAAGKSGILLHEAIGHAFEADFIRKGTSIFSEKLGEKICNEKINIVDDATVDFNRGSLNFDDEGVPGQKTYMVKDGVLNSFLHDRISAKYYGVAPTGNGRRESFRYYPIPRMRATYMESGDANEEDIIRDVKEGIYACDFSNGQVQIGEGDFTFYVKKGYLIENGKLTAPIKDINIIGNGPQALKDIVAVANNSVINDGTWTCGKDQYCCVSCGMPTVLVSNLTVGGE